tara:strand:+ start:171 stop:461 length:291 start_codon:yes stop_codon:yes gene_type:complete
MTSESAAGGAEFTGSVQRIYAPQGINLDRVSFGYWRRKGENDSEAIVTSTFTSATSNLADRLTLEKDATLEGPIIDFKISSSSLEGLIVYSNNVAL